MINDLTSITHTSEVRFYIEITNMNAVYQHM